MFRRKVSVDLSDEAEKLIQELHGDVQGLSQLMGDLITTHNKLVDMIRTDIVVAVETIEQGDEEGVSVFDEAEAEIRKSGKPRRFSHRVDMPQVMQEPIPRHPGSEVQATPFTRASRGEQVRWLVKVLASVDGDG